MYQNAAGARITLYLGALDGLQAAAAPTTAFQFHDEGTVSSFYWVDQGFGYALSGELPRPTLQALATAVYQQISAAPPAGARGVAGAGRAGLDGNRVRGGQVRHHPAQGGRLTPPTLL
mgnify:CR=1 FL=1